MFLPLPFASPSPNQDLTSSSASKSSKRKTLLEKHAKTLQVVEHLASTFIDFAKHDDDATETFQQFLMFIKEKRLVICI